MLFADLDDRTAALSELELRQTDETLPDGLRRVAREIVEKLVGDPESEEAQIRLRIIASRPSLQAAALLRQRGAERVLASRLAASYKDQLDPVLAAAVVGAFTAALRAAAGETGSDLSVRSVRRAVARVSHLLEHGLRADSGRSN